jgi:hypothetical protein
MSAASGSRAPELLEGGLVMIIAALLQNTSQCVQRLTPVIQALL